MKLSDKPMFYSSSHIAMQAAEAYGVQESWPDVVYEIRPYGDLSVSAWIVEVSTYAPHDGGEKLGYVSIG